IDLKTNKEGILASIEVPNGPVVSKYRVNMEDLEQIGVTALRNALYDESDIVIIDEIGKMELFSKNFANAVRDLLNSKKPVIGIVPIRSNHPLVLEIKKKRRDTKTYLITRQTSRNQREQIKTEIINSILTLTGKKQ
ncbi:MAG: nucleoside triphosphatase, partial [Thermoprotei archaeon]